MPIASRGIENQVSNVCTSLSSTPCTSNWVADWSGHPSKSRKTPPSTRRPIVGFGSGTGLGGRKRPLLAATIPVGVQWATSPGVVRVESPDSRVADVVAPAFSALCVWGTSPSNTTIGISVRHVQSASRWMTSSAVVLSYL